MSADSATTLKQFWDAARAAVPRLPDRAPAAWAFGAGAEQADELVHLVLAGTKTATSSSWWDHEAADEPVPAVGDRGIVLDGQGDPRAVVETVSVTLVPFLEVGDDHALAEGEGDRTLDSWRREHERFWREHSENDHGFATDMLVVCEAFDVVWQPSEVAASYARRAAEYTERLGSIAAVHPSDLQLVTAWANQVDGPVLDAGCGPGHWTSHLAGDGVDARGVDQVPAFVEHARGAHPGVPFRVGSIEALPDATSSIGGVLAWYSLIHHEPSAIHRALDEFARVLRPGGSLLVGFFTGVELAPFDHAVVPAWRWPPEALAAELRAAGFDIVQVHTRTAADEKPRPHGAIVAQLARDR